MKKLVLLFSLALVSTVLVLGLSVYDELEKAKSSDPSVWEDDIAQLEHVANAQANNPDSVIFIGSSSIRLWHSLAEDMAPIPTIQQGFGGAIMNDAVHYSDRLIAPYPARAVVIFVGSNDINNSDQPMQQVPVIISGLTQLLNNIDESHPDAQVYYLAITPTPYSWHKWDAVQAANAAAAALLETRDNAHYIETAQLFLDDEGEPIKKLYAFDGLHLSDKGYLLWTATLKPLLSGKL